MIASKVLPARGSPRSLLAAVALVGALALAGGALGIAALTASDDGADRSTSAVGEPIATSYGSITVEHVATLGGLTSQELGGMTHGIQNLVLSDKAQVEVSVLIVNRGDERIHVEPSQFSLTIDGSTDPDALIGSTIRPLALEAGTGVEATLTFVVPHAAARLSVGYSDPGGALITIPVGELDQGPATQEDGHTH